MKILHVTDLHFYRPWFAWVADHAAEYDAIAISGDLLHLCHETPLDSQIEWVSDWLCQLTTPVVVCSGNHDFAYRRRCEWLSKVALARAEGSALRFYSMSTQIEQEKRHYDDALEAAQKGTLDITAWLEWFLKCFERAVASALSAVERVIEKSARWETIRDQLEPNERQRKVLNALLDAGEEGFSTSRYATLAGTSLDTALRDIKELVGAGAVLVGPARGRSTSYRLVS